MQNKHRPFDCIKAAPKGQGPSAWMKRYFKDQSASFSYMHYGDKLASNLALHWCSIMEHYYQTWMGQPNAEYVYKPEDRTSVPKPHVLLGLLDDLPLTHPVQERYQAIVNLEPILR